MTSIFLQVEEKLNILTYEDDLNFISSNGRLPQYFGRWKTTSILWKMEDNFKIYQKEDTFSIMTYKFSKLKTTSIFWPMRDNLNILANGRRPEYVDILKATSMFLAHER
jgi:hypothetical protein